MTAYIKLDIIYAAKVRASNYKDSGFVWPVRLALFTIELISIEVGNDEYNFPVAITINGNIAPFNGTFLKV